MMGDEIAGWISQVVLGFLQGLTEVFPVSSSAHVGFGGEIWAGFIGSVPASFDNVIFLHLGTVVAILLWYQRDVLSLWRSAISTLVRSPMSRQVPEHIQYPLGRRTPWLLFLSLAVTGIIGVRLEPVAHRLFQTPMATVCFLFINGVFLLIVGCMESGTRRIHELGWRDYVWLGAVQGIAAIPGLSRFGLTLCAGLLADLEWYQALKLSFLLSLPTVLAAAAFEWLVRGPQLAVSLPALVAGIIVATLSAWIAIRVMLRHSLHARRRLIHFGLYCMAAAPFFGLYILCLR